MIKEDDAKTLADLNRIVARHGPSSITRLAELIRDPQRAEELADVLELAARRVSRPSSKSKSRENDRVGMGILSALRGKDPAKHAVLAEIRSNLIHGAILHTMLEIRHFTVLHNLEIGSASSRKAAIAPLLRSLSKLPTPEIASLRDSMIQSKVDDRSLEKWREVIVRPGLQKVSANDKPS